MIRGGFRSPQGATLRIYRGRFGRRQSCAAQISQLLSSSQLQAPAGCPKLQTYIETHALAQGEIWTAAFGSSLHLVNLWDKISSFHSYEMTPVIGLIQQASCQSCPSLPNCSACRGFGLGFSLLCRLPAVDRRSYSYRSSSRNCQTRRVRP
jgi:hypothetical protein